MLLIVHNKNIMDKWQAQSERFIYSQKEKGKKKNLLFKKKESSLSSA